MCCGVLPLVVGDVLLSGRCVVCCVLFVDCCLSLFLVCCLYLGIFAARCPLSVAVCLLFVVC